MAQNHDTHNETWESVLLYALSMSCSEVCLSLLILLWLLVFHISAKRYN